MRPDGLPKGCRDIAGGQRALPHRMLGGHVRQAERHTVRCLMASDRERSHVMRQVIGLGREDLCREQIGEVLTWMARGPASLAGPLGQ